jgi:glycosyltransferase involved in cell wall biosynthesis
MKISIALCTYNGTKHLLEQLKSIEMQTRKPDELVVCDDKSSDATLDILYSFKDKCDFSVRIYENESNLGSTRNFEKAIRLCEGDIIALSDQDDVWTHTKLEKIAMAFEQNPDIGYVFSDAELVDERLAPLRHNLWESVGFRGDLYKQFVKGDQFLCLLRQHIVTGATMAFRSSLRNLVFPFPTDMIWIHDGWIAIIASGAGKLGLPLPEPLILYRQHPSQQMGVITPEESLPKKIKELYAGAKNINQGLIHYMLLATCVKQRLLLFKERFNMNTGFEINLIEELQKHYSSRFLINSSSGRTKLKMIFKELISGRYRRFSNSWLSAFRDSVM